MCIDQFFTLKQVSEKAIDKKRRVYVGFIVLEKPYNRVNRKALWQVLRMYDLRGKLLSGIKEKRVGCQASKENGAE